jgi:hypothetical protein
MDDNPFAENDPFASVVKAIDDAERIKSQVGDEEDKRKADFLSTYRARLYIVEKCFADVVNSPSIKEKLGEDFKITTHTPREDARELSIMGGRTLRCTLAFAPLVNMDGICCLYGCVRKTQGQREEFPGENLSEPLVYDKARLFVRYVIEANPLSR